jgi:choline dehydrogenase
VYGSAGPLYISELRSPNVTTAAFLQACEELGLTRLAELNGRSNEGYSPTPVTQNRGRRWSAADAYLRPALKRPNLTVITGATVDRVVFEGTRAVGIEHGGGALVKAKREVILSAGSIGSPYLLMRSGVGAADELRDAGVTVVRDLPEVGKNLQDHLTSGVFVHCKQPVTLTKAESIGNLLRYIVLRSGMLTTNVGEAVAFIKTSPEEPAPDIELIFAPGPFIDHGLTPPTGHGLTVGVILLQPESRGRIGLNGRDPVIDPGYLTQEADVKRLVAGLKTAKQVFATSVMKAYAGGPMPPYDGPESDDELAQWIRERGETLYHPVGTCRMGLDAESVVDPSLKVRGLDGLRVVDVSIMPTLNRGHTHAPAIMIGEKGSELIAKR